MKFEEIFKKEGLYRSEDFRAGVCFKVDKGNNLSLVTYNSFDDFRPDTETPLIYGGLFNKEYFKVNNTKQLFPSEGAK